MKEITILVFSVTCVPGSGSPLKVPSVTSLAFTSRPETETHFYGYFYPSVENSGAVLLQHSKYPSIFWPLQHFHCLVHSDLYEREKTHSTYPITGKPIKSTDVDQENKKEKTRKGKQKFKTKKKVESSRGQQRTAKQFTTSTSYSTWTSDWHIISFSEHALSIFALKSSAEKLKG